MRPHLLIVPILALCAASAQAQDASSSVDVLAAIAADAGAPTQQEAPPVLTLTERMAEPQQAAQAMPQQASSAALPVPESDQSSSEPAVDHATAQTIPLAPPGVAADAIRGTCNIGRGERWQQQPNLTLDECAAALTGGSEPYDEHGLRHAYWPGVYLSASSTAVYQSNNGSDWTRLQPSATD